MCHKYCIFYSIIYADIIVWTNYHDCFVLNNNLFRQFYLLANSYIVKVKIMCLKLSNFDRISCIKRNIIFVLGKLYAMTMFLTIWTEVCTVVEIIFVFDIIKYISNKKKRYWRVCHIFYPDYVLYETGLYWKHIFIPFIS